MAKPNSANNKSRLSHLLESSWFWAIVCLLFILLPIVWQWLESGNPNPLATLRRIFSGDIDWQAWWSFGTFLVAVVAALIAYSEYLGHKKEIEVQSAQKEKDYILQTRPYVILHVIFERGFVFLEVKNIGHTPARNIKLTVDPKLEKLAGEHNRVHELIHHALGKQLSFIAPGQRLIFAICTGKEAAETYEEKPNDSSFPATVEYENMNQQSFTESYNLDIGDYVDAIQEEDPLKNISKSINAVATNIERSAKTEKEVLNQISQTLNSLIS